MKLVVVTQRVDPDDPALGATVPMLHALAAARRRARRADARARATPACRRTCASSRSPRRRRRCAALRFAAALAPELRRRPVAVLAHMSPIYAVLAAPLTRPLRVPLLLWFTHWRASRLLRLAERVSTRVLTRRPALVPARLARRSSRSGTASTSRAPVPATPATTAPLRLLALGRTSPAKGLDDDRRGGGARWTGVELELRGPVADRRGARVIARQLARDGARSRTPVPRREIAAVYARAGVLVNNMRSGALDKVVFEAAAAVPAGARRRTRASRRSSPASSRRCASRRTTRQALAGRHPRAARRGARAARTQSARELRARVERDHSVEHWADGVLDGVAMTRVLHVQKVSGVSGLGGAPALAAARCCASAAGTRGMLVLHEGEPGAREFVERDARRAACRPSAGACAFDLDPPVPAAPRCGGAPDIVHTHLVHADVLGLPAGGARARAGARQHEARLQRVPRRTALVARGRPRRGALRAPPDRDLARARALPRATTEGFDARRVHGRPLRDRAGAGAAAAAARRRGSPRSAG